MLEAKEAQDQGYKGHDVVVINDDWCVHDDVLSTWIVALPGNYCKVFMVNLTYVLIRSCC